MNKNFASLFSNKRKLQKEEKFCGPSSYIQSPSAAIWSNRDYTQLAEQAFIRNVIANRSISLIAISAASIPIILYRRNRAGHNEIIKRHPILDLLSNPSPSRTMREFFEEIYYYRLLSGNSYSYAIIQNAFSTPSELHNLRPDRVAIKTNSAGKQISYSYSVNGKAINFAIDEISGLSALLHLKNFHPLNDWYGLSSIESAAYSIDQHNESVIWNQSLLQNGARPSGVLVCANGKSLTEEQYQRLKKEFDIAYKGAVNAGRPMLLEGGIEWKEMSLSPRDMDFLNSKHSAARDIALAFGVPPQMLGIPGDNTYSNMAEARLALWEQTIIPLMDNVINGFSKWLCPMFDERFSIAYDKDAISAISSRRDQLWTRVEAATFMTINEKRAMIDLPPIAGGDVIVNLAGERSSSSA